MNINSEIVLSAVKKALEASNIKSVQNINVDDLAKTITDSILKSIGESADIKNVGAGLMKGIQSAINNK